MCEPTTLTAIGLIANAVGVGVSAYSSYKQTQASNDAAEYNAQMSERNARISEMQAQNAEARGENEKASLQRKIHLLKGQQRAGFGASGALVGSGSALDVLQDTDTQASWDMADIDYNTQSEAWGHRIQGDNYSAQARLSRSTKSSPWLSAGGTLLSGVGQLGYQYGTAKASGSLEGAFGRG